MKFHLVRHGRTTWNDLNHIQGKTDIPLNTHGILQASTLATELDIDNLPIGRIYSSPLKRAASTAEILGDVLDIPVYIHEGLREIDLGDWEGLSWDEVAKYFPADYKKWHDDRRYVPAPHGESYNDMLMRVLDALKEIADSYAEDVIIVTHSAVIMALMCYIHNEPFHKMKQYKAPNATVKTIDSNLLFNKKSD